MSLGLAMVVRDEERNIEACLAPIVDLVDRVAVADTGSTDRTVGILRDRFGIEALVQPLDAEACDSIEAGRNRAISSLDTDWILCLDADERVEWPALADIRARLGTARTDGFFCRWDTYGLGEPIEDYKLALFRAGYRSLGLVHGNVQADMRRRGRQAEWQDRLTIRHYPDAAGDADKHRLRRQQLACALRREPDWYRHHWFMGYSLFREGRLDEAEGYLRLCADARSGAFPVECLNSHVVLAEIRARAGDGEGAQTRLDSALRFRAEQADDFEVRVNFRLGAWLRKAMDCCARGALDGIRAYRFAY